MKILIAEDEPDIRELLIFTLQSFGGFEVVAASNGAEAVERAPDVNPDLILLDVRMPRMTGYEACRALKADPKTASIPIIFLSAKGQEAEVKAGLESGAMDYILKPFAPDLLVKRVQEIMSRIEADDSTPSKETKGGDSDRSKDAEGGESIPTKDTEGGEGVPIKDTEGGDSEHSKITKGDDSD